MDDWIPFKEGEYLVERASLLASDERAVLLEDVVVSIFQDRTGRRQMNGHCRVRNILIVNLLDEHDVLDLALDFGGQFKYLVKDPLLKSGKVFSPKVASTLQFIPREPWKQVPEGEFETLWERLKFLSD